ncbi:MAG: hypothetical protein CVT64_03640 [Actinobacteria bacterium HGW-Actinobacteria-4]|nr:MAG: hypothetical protein CVT64_03640 [Actinobacteria bacterium HGW-Actinobacteria-4]
MFRTTSLRTVVVAVALSFGAVWIAGCSADPDTSPSVSPPPTVNATPDPSQDFADQGGTMPDPTATGVTRTDSLAGRLSADIPNAWGLFPPATAQQALEDPSVTDVLGLWVAGITPETQHNIVVMGQVQDDPPLGAQEYFDLYFAEFDEPAIAMAYEIFTSSTGREVLFVDLTSEPGSGFSEESVFFVFTEYEVVVGLVSSPDRMDQGVRDAVRVVADTLAIADLS